MQAGFSIYVSRLFLGVPGRFSARLAVGKFPVCRHISMVKKAAAGMGLK
ncbi:hypothetical protein [Methylomusa anaerophila]|nr:hypothetical protein [Methylomusa anaerophila]